MSFQQGKLTGSCESPHRALDSYRHSWNSLYKSFFSSREALKKLQELLGRKEVQICLFKSRLAGRDGRCVENL